MKHPISGAIALALLAGCAGVSPPPAGTVQTAPPETPAERPADLAAPVAAAAPKPVFSGPAPADYPLAQLPFAVKSPIAMPALNLFPKPFATGTYFMESRAIRKDGLYPNMIIPLHERIYPASAGNLLHKSVQTSDFDGQPLYLREISLKWNGLIDLHAYFLGQDAKTLSLESALQAFEITSNKWPRLQKGASFAYKATYSMRIPDLHRSKMRQSGSCTVTEESEANNALPGKAYVIECISRYQDDPSDKRVRYNYYVDPSFLFQVQDQKDGVLGLNALREHHLLP